MRPILRLLLLIIAVLAGIQLMNGVFKSPAEEPIAALEIRNIELPILPQKREAALHQDAPVSSPPSATAKLPAASLPSQPPAASLPIPPAPAVNIVMPQPLRVMPEKLSDQEFYSRFSGAIVQIFCQSQVELFSASGVIVNERGLVLTNAHVAEIVEKVGEKKCQARHGNPADPFAKIEVVYVASTTPKIPGTPAPGVPQRDFAFLRITEARESFSYAAPDIALVPRGETLLTLGYPSEFLQGINASRNSNLVFSALSVDGYADVDGDLDTAEGYVSRGGLILQQGSSGTALFTRSGKVVGLIFATTKGETTADRDGLALTAPYIDKILKIETGEGLMEFIANH